MDNLNSTSQSGGKNLKLAAIFVAAVIIIAGVYLFWQAGKSSKESGEAESKTTAADIPNLQTNENIGESVAPAQATSKVPELNPTNVVNPFKDVYQNPFSR